MLRLNILWLINIHPLLLAFFCWFLPNKEIITMVFSKWWISIIPSMFISWNCIVKKSFLFSLIYLFLNCLFISVWVGGFLFSSMSYIIHYHRYFVVQIILDLAIERPFKEVPVSFLTCSYYSLGTFLPSVIRYRDVPG